jgi:hypothetical protein
LHSHPSQGYDEADVERLAELKERLDKILGGLRSGTYIGETVPHVHESRGLAREQLDVLERQVGVLENAATRLLAA